MSKMKLASKSCLTLLFGMVFVSQANAANLSPATDANLVGITDAKYDFVDTPNSFTVTLRGPNVRNSDLGAFLSESASNVFKGEWWEISLDVTTDNPIQMGKAGSIFTSWSAVHLKGPHGEERGSTWSGSLKNSASEGTITKTRSAFLDHESHLNLYDASLNSIVVDLAQEQITTWTFNISGVHTPEPSSIISILAVGGLGCTLALRQKYR